MVEVSVRLYEASWVAGSALHNGGSERFREDGLRLAPKCRLRSQTHWLFNIARRIVVCVKTASARKGMWNPWTGPSTPDAVAIVVLSCNGAPARLVASPAGPAGLARLACRPSASCLSRPPPALAWLLARSRRRSCRLRSRPSPIGFLVSGNSDSAQRKPRRGAPSLFTKPK